MVLVGVVGKPNAGKTTFLNASCMTSAKVADYPFTTVEANKGIAYVRRECVCKEFGVEDSPRNSLCVEGTRLIPVEVLDVAGLVPDAWQGRGLGNKFLDDLRRADVLIHVVDGSGSLDAEGNPVEPGSRNPLEDVLFLEREITMWLIEIIKRDWDKACRRVETEKIRLADLLADRLSGLAVKREHILQALLDSGLKADADKPKSWSEEDLYNFVNVLRRIAKPMLIALNKVDRPYSKKFIDELKREIEWSIVVPCSALAEYFLRKTVEKETIRYVSGDSGFNIVDRSKLSDKEVEMLGRIDEEILKVYGSCGVQEAIDKAMFDLLGYIVVFPVEDANKLTDHEGRVLPDAFLVPKGTTAKQFAGMIHEDLAKTFVNAIDVRKHTRMGADHVLEDNMVIKITAAGARG
ncbi:MAG: redox-regulated ATPase YchF [Candidatus Hodarchaeota archaeon]